MHSTHSRATPPLPERSGSIGPADAHEGEARKRSTPLSAPEARSIHHHHSYSPDFLRPRRRGFGSGGIGSPNSSRGGSGRNGVRSSGGTGTSRAIDTPDAGAAG